MTSLAWGLLVATKDRLDELEICVRMAVAQTRPPSEVIVVDASAAWQDHARAIGGILAAHPGIRFAYRPADQPSLTVQRNQALDAAAAEIVFLIDDDSFMHPGCAEEIMRIYEADRGREVAGIQAALDDAMPGEGTSVQAAQKTEPLKRRLVAWAIRFRVARMVLIFGMEGIFIPYDGGYPPHGVPEALEGFEVTPTRLMHGARMTYRRENARAERFDPILRYYCPFEDQDASYRISRTGRLLTARAARLHHYETASGRIRHFDVTLLERLNRAVLLKRHGKDIGALRRAYYRILRRHMLADLVKDALSMRFSLPKLRATIRARMLAPRVFRMSQEEIEAWYPGEQARIVTGRG